MARPVSRTLTARPKFSPHTRGWPEVIRPGFIMREVLPAHAGMARRPGLPATAAPTFSPHTRGWPDNRWESLEAATEFSPHTRGWPVMAACWDWAREVLPAHAGMARTRPYSSCTRPAFSPHTRGWPSQPPGPQKAVWRSPRTRGDGPRVIRHAAEIAGVLPAHAGMALLSLDTPRISPQFSPHTRGWPGGRMSRALATRSSPRTRGDGPHPAARFLLELPVLPAHAGMARADPQTARFRLAVLPAHAGMARDTPLPKTRSVPVLPAHAGMARVPACHRRQCHCVLPAHAGMARPPGDRPRCRSGFSPHTRGWPGDGQRPHQ